MRRRIIYVMVSLGMVLGLMVAPSATAATATHTKTAAATATTATYKRHLTSIGSGTNTACPVGQKKYIMITGRLAAGQTFIKLRVFYLRLTNGTTPRSYGSGIITARKAIWYVKVSRTAKVSSKLTYSYTSVDTQGGATWTATTSKICGS